MLSLVFRRDHLPSISGIICGPIWGSFAVWESFAVGDHLRRWNSFLFKVKTNKPAFVNIRQMDDSNNTLGSLWQERKCRASLETENAG